jgi:hypothetical protein
MAALHLVYTFAALAENLADLREAQQRRHQAQAARQAAGQLRACVLPGGRMPAGAPATLPPPPAGPQAGRYAKAPAVSDWPPGAERRGRPR